MADADLPEGEEAKEPESSEPGPGGVSEDARLYGMLCHLAALAGFVGVPLGNILGPLVVWLIKREEYPFVDQQGKAALNFQISMTIYGIIAGLLVFVVIGLLLVPAVILVDLVLLIIAAVKANKGESYEYPLAIPFIK